MKKTIVATILLLLVLLAVFSIYNYGRNAQWWGTSDRIRTLQNSSFLSKKLAEFEQIEISCTKAAFMEKKRKPECAGKYDAGSTPEKEALEKVLDDLTRNHNVYRTDSNADRGLADTDEYTIAIAVDNYETNPDHLHSALLAYIYTTTDGVTGNTLVCVNVEYLSNVIRSSNPRLAGISENGVFVYDPIKNQYYLPSTGRYFIENPDSTSITDYYIYTDTGEAVPLS